MAITLAARADPDMKPTAVTGCQEKPLPHQPPARFSWPDRTMLLPAEQDARPWEKEEILKDG